MIGNAWLQPPVLTSLIIGGYGALLATATFIQNARKNRRGWKIMTGTAFAVEQDGPVYLMMTFVNEGHRPDHGGPNDARTAEPELAGQRGCTHAKRTNPDYLERQSGRVGVFRLRSHTVRIATNRGDEHTANAYCPKMPPAEFIVESRFTYR